MIYGYFRDKDVFEREYQHYLAHRLLNNTSADDAMEQKMIGLLKNECGYHWAQKLEDMFKDIQTSREVMKDFKRTVGSSSEFQLDVNICEFSKWPDSIDQKKMSGIRPPVEMAETELRLKEFYESRHNGRKFFIRWDKGGGECMVTFNRKKNDRRLLVFSSTYQMMIMLCFNEKAPSGKPIWKFAELKDRLGISEEELEAALFPLVHPKLGVLQKKPKTSSFEADHMVRLNGKFKNPQKRIVVPTKKPEKQKNKYVIPQEILKQRQNQMDAAIVRIMKARRTLHTSELQGEVIQQLIARFQPESRSIKKRIEVLISQDYLERDEDDRNILHYKS